MDYRRFVWIRAPERGRCPIRRARRSYLQHVRMPTISRFLGIVITMYFDDHGHPHFHARHGDGEAKVRIDNLEVMDSTQVGASCGSSSAGPNFISQNWKKTGAERELVRHLGQ